jgi:hypothetical protein
MNPIPDRPIAERIAWLFELARRHGEAFRSPDAWLARQRYLAEHPTAIAVMKCMDGRINIPVATRMPAGIVMPFRNLGGMFDLGWPHLGEVVAHHIERMVGDGRRILFLITYHWSRGNPKRGCAGFGYDTAAAIAHTQQIRRQMEHIFGRGHATVHPLVCGFETDEESLTLHGNDGASLDLSTLGADDQPTLEPRLAALLPDLPAQMRADLLPCSPATLHTLPTSGPRSPAASASSTSSTANGPSASAAASTSCTPPTRP